MRSKMLKVSLNNNHLEKHGCTVEEFVFSILLEEPEISKFLDQYYYKKYTRFMNVNFKCLSCTPNEYISLSHFVQHNCFSKKKQGFGIICDICMEFLGAKDFDLILKHFSKNEHVFNLKQRKALVDEYKRDPELFGPQTKFGWTGVQTPDARRMLQNYQSLDDQVQSVLREMEATSRQTQIILPLIEKDIKRIISNTFPNASVQFYGSRVSGLATNKSDVDIYIDTTSVLDLKPILSQSKEFEFKEIRPNASVPLLILKHIPTGIECDFICTFNRSYYDNKLIQLYISDPKIKWVVTAVLIWAKYNNLIGRKRISKLGMVVMVLFILARRKVIPTMELLLKNKKGKDLEIFELNISSMMKKTKKHWLSEVQLLHTFFKEENKRHLMKHVHVFQTGKSLPIGFIKSSQITEKHENIIEGINIGNFKYSNTPFQLIGPFPTGSCLVKLDLLFYEHFMKLCSEAESMVLQLI